MLFIIIIIIITFFVNIIITFCVKGLVNLPNKQNAGNCFNIRKTEN